MLKFSGFFRIPNFAFAEIIPNVEFVAIPPSPLAYWPRSTTSTTPPRTTAHPILHDEAHPVLHDNLNDGYEDWQRRCSNTTKNNRDASILIVASSQRNGSVSESEISSTLLVEGRETTACKNTKYENQLPNIRGRKADPNPATMYLFGMTHFVCRLEPGQPETNPLNTSQIRAGPVGPE